MIGLKPLSQEQASESSWMFVLPAAKHFIDDLDKDSHRFTMCFTDVTDSSC